MSKMMKRVIGICTAIAVVAVIVIVVFFQITKKESSTSEQVQLPKTEVGKILAKDLDEKYPKTATEVVKMYWRINKCMYNTKLSDEDTEKLLTQIRKLYDEELLAKEENSLEQMLENFKKDKEKRLDEDMEISITVVQKNKTLKVAEVDGKKYTSVVTSTLMEEDGDKQKLYESFMCRKDSEGNWKIVGWKQISAKEAMEADIE